jgi:hypothetical protein
VGSYVSSLGGISLAHLSGNIDETRKRGSGYKTWMGYAQSQCQGEGMYIIKSLDLSHSTAGLGFALRMIWGMGLGLNGGGRVKASLDFVSAACTYLMFQPIESPITKRTFIRSRNLALIRIQRSFSKCPDSRIVGIESTSNRIWEGHWHILWCCV